MSPEEAAKVSGPVLVRPPIPACVPISILSNGSESLSGRPQKAARAAVAEQWDRPRALLQRQPFCAADPGQRVHPL